MGCTSERMTSGHLEQHAQMTCLISNRNANQKVIQNAVLVLPSSRGAYPLFEQWPKQHNANNSKTVRGRRKCLKTLIGFSESGLGIKFFSPLDAGTVSFSIRKSIYKRQMLRYKL
jgi:hypothetical protein